MDSMTLAQAFDGYKELVNHAESEAFELAAALGFLAQAVDDMDHDGRAWSVGALVLFMRGLEKRSRDLFEYLDTESTARSPKPSVGSKRKHIICRQLRPAGEVADALKKIVEKVETETPQE
jgi:hypothetical protein